MNIVSLLKQNRKCVHSVCIMCGMFTVLFSLLSMTVISKSTRQAFCVFIIHCSSVFLVLLISSACFINCAVPRGNTVFSVRVEHTW